MKALNIYRASEIFVANILGLNLGLLKSKETGLDVFIKIINKSNCNPN